MQNYIFLNYLIGLKEQKTITPEKIFLLILQI